MIDLTKIEKPFGLLDAETQAAMREYNISGGKVEVFTDYGWQSAPGPAWVLTSTYRVKPLPPPLIEGWVNVYEGSLGGIHKTREAAISRSGDAIRTVLVREVRE